MAMCIYTYCQYGCAIFRTASASFSLHEKHDNIPHLLIPQDITHRHHVTHSKMTPNNPGKNLQPVVPYLLIVYHFCCVKIPVCI